MKDTRYRHGLSLVSDRRIKVVEPTGPLMLALASGFVWGVLFAVVWLS